MMTEKDIQDFFNATEDRQTNTGFPICTFVKRDQRRLYAEFVYLSGIEYCCFECRCHLGEMEDLISDPEFGIDTVELHVNVEKGVRSSDKFLDKFKRKADSCYSVHVPKK